MNEQYTEYKENDDDEIDVPQIDKSKLRDYLLIAFLLGFIVFVILALRLQTDYNLLVTELNVCKAASGVRLI